MYEFINPHLLYSLPLGHSRHDARRSRWRRRRRSSPPRKRPHKRSRRIFLRRCINLRCVCVRASMYIYIYIYI